jgi:hypothetical protein
MIGRFFQPSQPPVGPEFLVKPLVWAYWPEQGRARGRADRMADVVIGEFDALGTDQVEGLRHHSLDTVVGSSEGCPQAGEALVVGLDHDDVRPDRIRKRARRLRETGTTECSREEQCEEQHECRRLGQVFAHSSPNI